MSINFLLDENIPFALIEFLQKKGYSAEHLKKIDKVGIKNGEVYQFAEKKHFWIVTRDSDFGSYKKFIDYDVAGIILFKLSKTNTQYLITTLDKFLKTHHKLLLSKHLIMIKDDKIEVYK